MNRKNGSPASLEEENACDAAVKAAMSDPQLLTLVVEAETAGYVVFVVAGDKHATATARALHMNVPPRGHGMYACTTTEGAIRLLDDLGLKEVACKVGQLEMLSGVTTLVFANSAVSTTKLHSAPISHMN